MKYRISFLIAAVLTFAACGPKLPDAYHMDKRFWDPDDYHEAVRYIKFSIKPEEGLPRFSDPVTAPVFQKLSDVENVSVLLEDETLGLNYRQEVAQAFFDEIRDLFRVYQRMDIQDKYVYPMELVEIIELSLHTQLLYFGIGNRAILDETVNPEDAQVQRVLRSNEQTVVDNFINYLDILAKESAFSQEALNKMASLTEKYYIMLIEQNPTANFSKLKNTAKLLAKKSGNDPLKASLNTVVNKIEGQ